MQKKTAYTALTDFYKKYDRVIDRSTLPVSIDVANRLTENDLRFRIWINWILFLIPHYSMFLIWGLGLPLWFSSNSLNFTRIFIVICIVWTIIVWINRKKIEKGKRREGIWHMALLFKREVLFTIGENKYQNEKAS